MKVMLLAPQPFYQERGTPIAVDLVLRVLSERGDQVDLVTYHEGESVEYQNVVLHRTLNLPFISGIRPGFSLKKLVCDGLMLFKAGRMAARGNYQMVHAVEEAVFIAMMLKLLFKIPYTYDMDSSLSQQLKEKSFLFTPFAVLVGLLERFAVKHAMAVVPVCNALADEIGKYRPNKVVILRDVSLLKEIKASNSVNLRAESGVTGPLLMYVGNLEMYQGIDLLLDSFSLALARGSKAGMVIIGGKLADIQKYQNKARQLGIEQQVHFLGPKPVGELALYLSQADVLVSPRVKGQNTPMKLYSYLHSGKAVLATNLPTHTQVLNDGVALLVDATAEAFATGIHLLVNDAALRSELGYAGRELIEQQYTFAVFRDNLNGLYDWLSVRPVNTAPAR